MDPQALAGPDLGNLNLNLLLRQDEGISDGEMGTEGLFGRETERSSCPDLVAVREVKNCLGPLWG